MYPGRLSTASSMIVRRRPTLPQPPGCSTIGAERLDFRVRNGAGYFPLAMAAETLLSCPDRPARPTRSLVGNRPRPFLGNHTVDAQHL